MESLPVRIRQSANHILDSIGLNINSIQIIFGFNNIVIQNWVVREFYETPALFLKGKLIKTLDSCPFRDLSRNRNCYVSFSRDLTHTMLRILILCLNTRQNCRLWSPAAPGIGFSKEGVRREHLFQGSGHRWRNSFPGPYQGRIGTHHPKSRDGRVS